MSNVLSTTPEIWLPVEGYEKCYMVSNLGRVRSLDILIKGKNYSYLKKGRILKQSYHLPYPRVCLHKDNTLNYQYTHRLVAKAFIPNPKNGSDINHINGIKSDNRVENLEWCTHAENMQHALRLGLTSNSVGQIAKRATSLRKYLTQEQVASILAGRSSGKTFKQLTKDHKLSMGIINYILKNETWKYITITSTGTKI